MTRRDSAALAVLATICAVAASPASVGAQANHPPDDCIRASYAARSSHPIELGVAFAATQWPTVQTGFAIGPTVAWHIWSQADGASQPLFRTIEFSIVTNPASRSIDAFHRRETRFRLGFNMKMPGSSNVWPEVGVGATAHAFAWTGQGPGDVVTPSITGDVAVLGSPNVGHDWLPAFTRSLIGDLMVRAGASIDARFQGRALVVNPIGSVTYLFSPFAECTNQQPRRRHQDATPTTNP